MSRSYTSTGEIRRTVRHHGMRTLEDKYAVIREKRLRHKRFRKEAKKDILYQIEEYNLDKYNNK